MLNMKYLLRSDAGDGSDILPSYYDSDDILVWRAGAAIPSTDMVEADLDDLTVVTDKWDLPLHEATLLGDVLKEFCFLQSCFWYVDIDGKLRFKQIADEVALPDAVIDSSYILKGTGADIQYDEDSISPVITLRCNYDPLIGDFLTSLTLTDIDIAARRPDALNTVTIESRSLGVNRSVPGALFPRVGRTTMTELEMLTRRIQVASGSGNLFVTYSLGMNASYIGLGSIIEIDDDFSVDMAGDTLTGRFGRVVGRYVDWLNGTVRLRIKIFQDRAVIAPSATIASVASTTLTLSTGTPELFDGATYTDAMPARQFAAGWPVLLFNTSTGALAQRTIVSILSDTELTINSALGITVHMITGETYDSRGSGASVASTQTPDDWVYMVGASSALDGASYVTRWS